MLEIVWTHRAGIELQEVFEWLEDHNSSSGEKLMIAVARALEEARKFPELASYFEKPCRRILVSSKFGIIYVPEPTRIVVVSFVDLRRDLSAIRRRIRDWYDKK